MRHYIIADNQELTACGIIYTIRLCDPSAVYSVVSSKKELLTSLASYPDAIVFLDYSLFDFSSSSELINITERYSSASWIIISEQLEAQTIRSLYFGSDNISILYKDCSVEELETAIHYSIKSKRYLASSVSELLLRGSESALRPKKEDVLTVTEKDVIRIMAMGKSTKEVAAIKNLSFHTINTHRKNIFRKLQVNNIQEAVRKAISLGIIDMTEYYI